jgi:hypothetical protein
LATKPKVDLAEFYRLAEPRKPPCRIGFILTQLDAEAAAQLFAACNIDRGIINTGAIRKWLASRGYETSVPAITNHRIGTCNCGKETS